MIFYNMLQLSRSSWSNNIYLIDRVHGPGVHWEWLEDLPSSEQHVDQLQQLCHQPATHLPSSYQRHTQSRKYATSDILWLISNLFVGSRSVDRRDVCQLQEDLLRIRIIYNIGYGLSLVCLLLAVFIMVFFKKLHCQRNTIHINLFLSFILRAVLAFSRDAVLFDGLDNSDMNFNKDGNPDITGMVGLYTMICCI